MREKKILNSWYMLLVCYHFGKTLMSLWHLRQMSDSSQQFFHHQLPQLEQETITNQTSKKQARYLHVH
jgi:hypothetical protein